MNKYVVSIGDVALDIFSKIESGLFYATDTPAITSIHPGGSAANFATWISRLGGNSAFIGKVGNDFIGDYLIKDLENEGVILNISRGSGFTAIIIALIDNTGERTMITHRGESVNLSIKDVNFDIISKASLIFIPAYSLFFGKISKTIIDVINFIKREEQNIRNINLGKLNNIPDSKRLPFDKKFSIKNYRNALIAIDLSSYGGIKQYGPKKFENLLKGIKPDILFCNKDELMTLKHNLSLDEAISEVKNLSKIFTVKLGKNGCIGHYFNKNGKENIFSLKTRRLKVVDTTGAGDAFDAAFCYEYLKSGNVKESAEFANSFSSLVITKYGARPKIDFTPIKNF
ncbi:MAG: carbohydrate kinase family protein [Actinomycetia bacterium]|nr:carbohydrate kinase family protein [Actinomycetes bacterium]